MAAEESLNEQQFVHFYHGTSADAWEGIQRYGLRPSRKEHTVSESLRVASSYAQRFDNPRYPDQSVVVHLKLPEKEARKYVDKGGKLGKEYGLRRNVPSRFLEKVEPYKDR